MSSFVAWTMVFLLGTVFKLLAKTTAPIVVPLLSDDQRIHNGIWGVADATDLSWWNIAIRNGAHNMFSRPQVAYVTSGNTYDETLEQLEGFQWRYRRSACGDYVSFRMTWGKPRASKGKREFYIGWTMNETPTMRLTFFQLRPF